MIARVCSQALGDQILFVTRPDKKKVLFYNDKHCQFQVDEGETTFLQPSDYSHMLSLFWSFIYFLQFIYFNKEKKKFLLYV